MANQLTLTVGTNVAIIPLTGTNAKINTVILRFLAREGIPTDGLSAVQIGETFLLDLKRIVIDTCKDSQREELVTANSATVEATVEADNDI